jgi:uncharacterized protein (UPF0335 family)
MSDDNTAPNIGHNSQIGGIAGEALKQGIDRWERLEEEKKAIAQDQKDVLAGLKANGFDLKVVRKVIQLRKMDPQEREEMEQLIDLYRAVVGV